MRPAGPRVGVGQRVTSTVTIWPGSASRVSLRANDDVGGQPFIERRHEPESGGVDFITPDHGAGAALEHLDDAAFGAAVLAIALDAHHDAVAVQRFLEVVRGDENVLLEPFNRPFGHHEADAGGMAVELADDEIHAIRQAIAIAFDLDERPVVDEVAKVALERHALLARDAQFAQQLARRGRMLHTFAHASQ